MNGYSSVRIQHRRGAFFQAMPVPDRALARIRSHLEILRELEAIGRAGILAKPAEHAARSIIREMR